MVPSHSGVRARSRSPSPPSPPLQHKVQLEPVLINDATDRATTTTRRQALTFVALVTSSILAADQLSRLARRSRWTVLCFPLWTSTTLLVVIHFVIRRRSGPRGYPGLVEAVKQAVRGGAEAERRRALATGSSFVAVLALEVWALRRSELSLHQALEVSVLPALAAILARSRQRPERSLEDLSGGIALFVGMALMGTSASKLGLAFSLVKVPVEASLFALLRDGADEVDEKIQSDWLLLSAITAIVLSSLLLPIGFVLPEQMYSSMFSPVSYLLSSATILLSSTSFVLLFLTFATFDSALLPASFLLPRNTLTLSASWFSRGTFRGTRAQLLANYVGGQAALASLLRNKANSSEGGVEKENEQVNEKRGSPAPVTYLSLLPILLLAVHAAVSSSSTLRAHACSQIPPSLRPLSCHPVLAPLPSSSVDLVIAYYEESLENTRASLDYVRRVTFVAERESRVIILNKGQREEPVIRKALGLQSWDEVIKLENVGREGASYLQHILRRYNDTVDAISPFSRATSTNSVAVSAAESPSRLRGLADHTFFLQPHLAWTGIAKPRLWIVPSNVGFASFGPLQLSRCGEDSGHGSYPYLVSVYNMFRNKLCPPEGLVIAWSAQFVVSKNRILANSYQQYVELSKMIEAPSGHWLHSLWGPNDSGGPSNPTFGHTVERAWPTIFDCADPAEIDDKCFGETIGLTSHCSCRDT